MPFRVLATVAMSVWAIAACSVGAQSSLSAAVGSSAVYSPSANSAQPGYVAPDEAATLIGRCAVYGAIQAYFHIPSGSTFWTVFPRAGKAPELDGVEHLFVVVYRDPVMIQGMGGNPAASRETPTQVVCVVLPTGEANIYSGVSREGLNLPPGAHLGAPDASP